MESWTQPNKGPGDKILPFLILQKIVFIIINLFDLKVQFVCSYWSDLTVVFANRGHNLRIKIKNKHVYLSRTTGKSYNPQNVWKKCFLLHWLLLGFFGFFCIIFPFCFATVTQGHFTIFVFFCINFSNLRLATYFRNHYTVIECIIERDPE